MRGLRVTVADGLGWLAAGLSHDEILTAFPELTEADIRACLAWAPAAPRPDPHCTRTPPSSASTVRFGEP